MARTEVPNGDSIAAQVKGRGADDSYADIARQLTDDHRARPGLFQQDLAKVNDAFHQQGLLPGIDLVGVQGQDLVGRKADGSVVHIDATNLSRTEDGSNGRAIGINGRTATQEADGSGQVVVNSGDNPWTLGRDILKSQGISEPTNNQIANFYKEMTNLNGKAAMENMHPGDNLKYPASVLNNIGTRFTTERATDAEAQTRQTNQENLDAAVAGMYKTGDTKAMGFIGSNKISMDQINAGLTRTDLTEQERKGLEVLKTNFSQIANADGHVYEEDLRAWTDRMNSLAALERTQTIKDESM